MNYTRGFRGSVVSSIALAAATNMLAQPVYAICQAQTTSNGSGPPSISATESSTSQALEIMQRRKDEALAPPGVTLASLQTQQPAPAPAEPAAAAAEAAQPQPAPPAAQAAQASTAAAETAVEAAKPKVAKAKAPKPAPEKSVEAAIEKEAAPKAVPQRMASLKDDIPGYGENMNTVYAGDRLRSRGVWALGYADYDRNSDVNIGLRDGVIGDNNGLTLSRDDVTVTRKTRSTGTIAGMDWTDIQTGTMTVGTQLGVFGGYNNSRSTFTDGTFSVLAPVPGSPTNEEFFGRTNAREQAESGFLGVYGAYFVDHWTADLALKADFGQLNSENTLNKSLTLCPGTLPVDRQAEVDVSEYTIAANLAYRNELGPKSWFEPLAGFRFTYTDFGTSSGGFAIGAEDGRTLRLQIGARFGGAWVSTEGYTVTSTLAGLLYSDILIDGFVGKTLIGTAGGGTALVDASTLNDEGKVRVLGQFATVVDFGNGYSLFGDVEVRGGQDLFGVGGRAGVRYTW